MKYKVKTHKGKEIEIEIQEHLSYEQRCNIMDAAIISEYKPGKGEVASIKYGKLLLETVKAVIKKLPEGVTIDDISNASLDELFAKYAGDFGLDKKKVMVLSE